MTKCVIVCIIITCLATLKKLLGEVVENKIIYSLKSLLSFLWNFGLDSCGLGDAIHLAWASKQFKNILLAEKGRRKRTTSNVKEQVKYLPTTKQLRSKFSKSIGILYLHTFPFTELRICTFWLVKYHFPMHDNWVPPTLIPRGKFSLELVSNCWNHMVLVRLLRRFTPWLSLRFNHDFK